MFISLVIDSKNYSAKVNNNILIEKLKYSLLNTTPNQQKNFVGFYLSYLYKNPLSVSYLF